ncbi:alpha-mannosidase [Bifidobacterium sp. UTCIF-37]|uniref:Alpha-mannosidase n=1 Tax=Bifidobacterium callitrichos DSM 23973 TaxID=1437609 RepID=A0A087A9K2_9BIFI|nr:MULTISPECIES: alpha-mannosidase [Bifidobacterium]KFI55452.1 alpha-mannosidase [Bifidobacterium callitrichos DSM 23973]TPF87411.1 alpha-mannosidase [Bifidobacterium sp. UTCIF-37]TPF91187.1 alpha-mannosidase [Bifidobacterium sp. UTCIF-38]
MFLKPEAQLERCKRILRQRVDPHVHPVVAHLDVESFDIPGEPMPSAEFFARVAAGDIEFTPFTLGREWGTTWGTVWFRLTGQVPAGYPKDGRALEVVIDLGWYPHSCGGHIEGLVYRPDGTAIKAVHPLNHWVPFMSADGETQVPIDADGRFTLYLEAASNPLLLGVPPFIETELGERATGRPDEPYVFKSADLTEFDRDCDAYRVDLDVVSSLMELADKRSPRYWQLAKALQRSLNLFDERDHDSVSAAREALADVLARPANASAMNVSAVGHAHIDSAWLWPVRETRRKVARTVSNALALMDADPDFRYAMSSAQQYAWLEEDHPDLFARMKRRIEEGRFIPVGGMWVEADGMLPAGESLIRQITFGRRYFREHLGVEPKGIWLPDSFGYTGAWPQIARRAGYEWFLTQKISWNDTTKFPHHSFLWEGIDGSRIFTHFPPSDTYAAWCKAQELDYAEKNFQDKDLADRSLLLFGFGDGGGGPTRDMMDHLHRFENLEGVSRVTIEGPDDFFDKARTQIEENAGDEMPTYKGELYLELHRGTLTSQQDMKRGCRREESLLRTVEYLGAAAALADPDYVYPSEEMDRIWKTLLLNQFHDILPGSSISWVHREAREDYARDLARLGKIAADMCAVLRRANPDADLLPEARIAQYRADGASWRARPTVATYDGTTTPVTIERTDDGAVRIGNGLIDATIDHDGAVSSLIDVAAGRELVPEGSRLGRYELMKDEPAVWDAWEIERESLLMGRGLVGRIVAAGVENGRAVVRTRIEHGDTTIDTTITLAPESTTLDFHADVDWHEHERFLKVDLPLGIIADRATYDCQYGLVERPIVKNSASDEAKFESSTGRFAILAEPGYAAAVINGSLYGSDAAPIAGDAVRGHGAGTMFRLSLLSAPTFPDPRTDIGRHSFDWSVLADATVERVNEAACALNAPILADVPDIDPCITLESESGTVVMDWIKPADDGSGDIIARVYEATGGRASVRLHVAEALAGATVRETDVLEGDALADDLPRALQGEGRQAAEGARLAFDPFQLATLRLSRV